MYNSKMEFINEKFGWKQIMEIPASKHVGFCTVIILLSVFYGIGK